MGRMARRHRTRARPRSLRSPATDLGVLTRILGAIEEYVYVGEILPDGGYRLVYQGPCRGQFLGIEDAAHAATVIWADFVHPEDREAFRRMHLDAVTRGSLDGQYRLLGADGITRWVRDRGRIRREAGGRLFLDGSVLDVTAIHVVQDQLLSTVAQVNRVNAELERARAEADRQGRVDPLTGVGNRRVLPELLDRRLAGGDEGIGVLLLDIDRFKAINDRHGHAVGDAVLIQTAERVRRAIRTQDAVARIGGEEFLVLLHGISDAEALRRVGEAVRREVGEDPIEVDGTAIEVSVSVGAALSGREHTARESLLAAADRALYAAKHSGRDRVVLPGDPATTDPVASDTPQLRIARAMALATCARQGVAEQHLFEVAALAAAVAATMAAGPVLIERCRMAGLVHDVGKIAVPDDVLLKPGALDDAEWEQMRNHTVVGEQMVRRMPELTAVGPAVRHHHERVDGTGYPDGLAGDAIPLEARIIAAVDAYSAMTEQRPYRSARASAEAVAELWASAGTHLDEGVVRVLVDLIDHPAGGPDAPVAALAARA